MTRFDSSIPAAKPMPPFKEAVKRTPDRMVNLILVLPIVLGIGCVSLIGMSTLQWGIELIKRGRLLGLSVAFTGFVILVALVGLAFWIVKERLIETTEHIIGTAPDIKALPQEQPDMWAVEMTDAEHPNELEWVHFKTEQLRLAAVTAAYRMSQGTSFSEGALTSGKNRISRDQFYDLRDLFFERRWCVWRDPEHHTLGVVFTAAGRKRLRAWADLYLEMTEGSTPPPRISTPVRQNVLPAQAMGEWEGDE